MKASVAPPPAEKMTPSWELVRPSLDLVRNNFEVVLWLLLLPALLIALGTLLLGGTGNIRHISDLSPRQRSGAIVIIVGGLWSLLNLAPAQYFRVAASKKQTVRLQACYRRGLPFFWRLVAVDVLIGLMVLGGLVLLIVPGLIFLRRYYLASYYIVDQDLGIKAALQRASHDSKPVSGAVWGVIGVQISFSILASFISIIPALGILLAALVSYICLFLPALRYREIIAAVPAD